MKLPSFAIRAHECPAFSCDTEAALKHVFEQQRQLAGPALVGFLVIPTLDIDKTPPQIKLAVDQGRSIEVTAFNDASPAMRDAVAACMTRLAYDDTWKTLRRSTPGVAGWNAFVVSDAGVICISRHDIAHGEAGCKKGEEDAFQQELDRGKIHVLSHQGLSMTPLLRKLTSVAYEVSVRLQKRSHQAGQHRKVSFRDPCDHPVIAQD